MLPALRRLPTVHPVRPIRIDGTISPTLQLALFAEYQTNGREGCERSPNPPRRSKINSFRANAIGICTESMRNSRRMASGAFRVPSSHPTFSPTGC